MATPPVTPVPTPEPTPAPTPAPTPTGPLGWIEKVGGEIETGIIDIEKFIQHLPNVLKAWQTLEPTVVAAALQTFHDTWAALKSAEVLVSDVATGNEAVAVQIAPQTVAAFKQIYTNAVAGEKSVLAALKVLSATI